MSQSASQASIFYSDVARSRVVWTLRDVDGFVTFPTTEKTRRLFLLSKERKAIGLWSSQSRVMKVIQRDSNLAGCSPVEIPWDEFVSRWIPGLRKDRFLLGVNWSGERRVGYDLEPDELLQNVMAAMQLPTG